MEELASQVRIAQQLYGEYGPFQKLLELLYILEEKTDERTN